MQSSLRIKGLKLEAALLISCFSGVALAQVPIAVSGHVLNVSNKPIPGVTITANGVETAPAVTESSGLYTIVLKIPPGQPVHFHLERKNYSVLDKHGRRRAAFTDRFQDAFEQRRISSSGIDLSASVTGFHESSLPRP